MNKGTVKLFGKDYKLRINYTLIKNPTLDLNTNNIVISLPVYYQQYNVKNLINNMLNKLYKQLVENTVIAA